MNLVPSQVLLPFEYTAYDEAANLFMAMNVYQQGAPGIRTLVATVPMVHMYRGTYVGEFTPSDNTAYVIEKSSYTDDTYETKDETRSPGSESIYASAAVNTVQNFSVAASALASAAAGAVRATVRGTGAVKGIVPVNKIRCDVETD